LYRPPFLMSHEPALQLWRNVVCFYILSVTSVKFSILFINENVEEN